MVLHLQNLWTPHTIYDPTITNTHPLCYRFPRVGKGLHLRWCYTSPIRFFFFFFLWILQLALNALHVAVDKFLSGKNFLLRTTKIESIKYRNDQELKSLMIIENSHIKSIFALDKDFFFFIKDKKMFIHIYSIIIYHVNNCENMFFFWRNENMLSIKSLMWYFCEPWGKKFHPWRWRHLVVKLNCSNAPSIVFLGKGYPNVLSSGVLIIGSYH